MVESVTARMSVLPDVGSELPTVYVGNCAMDVVGLSVGQSCLRMDSEETLPVLQDERSVTSLLVHLWCRLVGLPSVRWTMTPNGWYHGTTARPLRPGLIHIYLEKCDV